MVAYSQCSMLCIRNPLIEYTQAGGGHALHILSHCGRPATQAGLLKKILERLFRYSWGAPHVSGGRLVYVRQLSHGAQEELPVASIKTHMIKHGAADNAGTSSVPMNILIQLTHHLNKAEGRLYQTREQADLRDYAQALNAPPHLRPRNRAFSSLDLYGKMLQLERLLSSLHTRLASASESHHMSSVESSVQAMHAMVGVMENLVMRGGMEASALASATMSLNTLRQSVSKTVVEARAANQELKAIAADNNLVVRAFLANHGGTEEMPSQVLRPSGNARPPAAAEPQALPTADNTAQGIRNRAFNVSGWQMASDLTPSDGRASFAPTSLGSNTVSNPIRLPQPRMLSQDCGATNSAQPPTPAEAPPTRPQGMAQAVQWHEVACTFAGTVYDGKGRGPVRCNPTKRGEGAADPGQASQKKRAHTSAIKAVSKWTESADDFKRVDTHRFGGAADVYTHATVSIHILQMCILISSLRASGWLCIHITKCMLRPMLRTHICVMWVRCVYTYALCILISLAAAVVQALRICIIW